MFIQQYSEKVKKWMVFGVGYVLCREGQTPIQKTIVPTKTSTTPRIHFSVTVGSALNEKREPIYQNIPCAVYGTERSKEIYNLALTLRRKDIVQFGGYVHEGEIIDNQGNPRKFREVRLDWLLPIKLFFSGKVSVPQANFNENVENVNKNINAINSANACGNDDFWEDEEKGE